MPSTSRTKSDLEDEVAELRAKLKDAQSIIGEALGYDPDEDDDAEEDDTELYADAED